VDPDPRRSEKLDLVDLDTLQSEKLNADLH
jgi:hypothetical protein